MLAQLPKLRGGHRRSSLTWRIKITASSIGPIIAGCKGKIIKPIMFALNVPSKHGTTAPKTGELATSDLFAALNSIPSTGKKADKPFGGMSAFNSTMLAKDSIVSVFDGLDVAKAASSPFGESTPIPSSSKEFVAAKKAQRQAEAELKAKDRAREEEKKRNKEALNPLMAQMVGGHLEDTKKMWVK